MACHDSGQSIGLIQQLQVQIPPWIWTLCVEEVYIPSKNKDFSLEMIAAHP